MQQNLETSEKLFNFVATNDSYKSNKFHNLTTIYMGKGFIKSTETRYIDENGQERVVTTQKEYAYKSNEDSFYMVFIKFVKWMYGIKSVSALKLLPRLLEMAQFNTGEISLSTGMRAQLMTELNLSKSVFTRALNELLENGALFPKVLVTKNEDGSETKTEIKGEYIVNPEMFWKGDLKKRRQLTIIMKSELEDEEQEEYNFEEQKEF